jgi:hypothetical protein
MFAWAGILYFTSAANPIGIDRAKAVFGVVFWGILIVITGWLIIQTVMRVVLTPTAYQKWNKIECVDANLRRTNENARGLFGFLNTGNVPLVTTGGDPSPTTGGVDTLTCGSGYTLNPLLEVCENSAGDTQEPLPVPASTGVTNVASYCAVSSCTTQEIQSAIAAYNAQSGGNQVTASSNVSFQNVNPNLLQAIMNDVAVANSGTVNITSVNDGGHSATGNHYTGNAVDVTIRNDQFNAYMAANFTPVPNQITPSLPAYKDSSGYIWTQEQAGSTVNSTGAHWHVSRSGR